ncbi:MAG: HlyD family efflux transporter periplasmic adaptor subunit [Candidatus Hydrogenedentes bacterium]|nr:HlyD family efflux transporter periplasmic adaptor subunit [Candidatus Hydrogenedentota bacterium]
MTTSSNSSFAPASLRRRKWPLRLILGALALALIYGLYGFLGKGEGAISFGTTFTAVRGPLEVSVVEGGSIEAKESQELKSEVQGTTKILTIVEEGYLVTPQDVAEGKLLVELDSKELLDRLTEQELQYQNALARFTEAREEHGIQINQNQSDVKAAELASKFALMDMKKFLGEKAASEIAEKVEENALASELAQAAGSEKEVAPVSPDAPASAGSPAPPEALARDPESGRIAMESETGPALEIDFTKYARLETLGDGQARQSIRKYEDDVVLAAEEVGVAESRLAGTKRLFEKDFVTKIEMENDELALKRKAISKDSAQTDMDLYVKYEFPKQAEKLVSDYEESLRKLQRARKLAVSKLAQAEANLNSAQASFELQSRKRDELKEQIEKCVIRATKPGLVVYGEGNRSYYRDNDRIEEGATVRERQVIITIPDTTQMTVEVKVHESYVKKVVKGQKARITVDAFPDSPLTGEVFRIAVLPDSQNRWMNPDLKVYATTITIDGQHDWLKPGMSAEGEIIIEVLQDVVKVPLQAVSQEGTETVVYVASNGMERRKVVTGSFDTSFIEIKEGLEAGEVVALRSPSSGDSDEKEDESGEDKEEKKEDEAPAVEAPKTPEAA